MKARGAGGNTLARLAASRRDHAANAFAMTDLRAESEVARRGLDVDRPTRSFRFRGVDFEPNRPAGGRASGGDVLGRDPLRMRDEIGELLAALSKARRNGGVRRILHVDVGPVGQGIEP